MKSKNKQEIERLEKGCKGKKFNREISYAQGEKVYDICGLTRIDEGIYLCLDCKAKLQTLKKANNDLIEDVKNVVDELKGKEVIENWMEKQKGFFITGTNLKCPICKENISGKIITKKTGLCIRCFIEQIVSANNVFLKQNLNKLRVE